MVDFVRTPGGSIPRDEFDKIPPKPEAYKEIVGLTPIGDAIDLYKSLKEGDMMQAAIAAGMMGIGATPAGPLAKGAKLAKKAIPNDLLALNEKRKKIMKEANEDYGERMGVTIHSTNYAGPLHVGNFKFRKPNIPGKGNEPGIFTHSPLDPSDYGKRKFAVLYKDKPGNYVAGKQDTESDFSEIFIPERAVEDIFEID